MHKGNITPKDAYSRLKGNPNAVIIDVRSEPEWMFVGVPLVERLVRLSWQVYPGMEVNARFVPEVKNLGLAPDTEILCLCRSGARSSAAATALTQAGFTNCWNIAEGFEGDRDGESHRGKSNGWKAAGLPWAQS